ncbi:hypothetical protein L0128_06275 [candidate division KSB1 bacterium]|nr:hypothetical protein [candidate division KSB1 bacterium]
MNQKGYRFLIFTGIIILVFNILAQSTEKTDKNVTVMDLSGDWEAAGDLQWQALLLSLQGIANKYGPHLYLIYPEDYKHPDVKAVLEYYQQRHHLKTTRLTSVEAAVAQYKQYLKGYVVWDTAIVPSLMVSFTVAGLEEALVITENYLPLVEKLGLRPVADFRAKFTGQSDLEIFRWAYTTYWPKCSRDYLIYLGEYCKGLKGGPGMQPGIADFGITQQAFFTDLSASPIDPDEYQLADKIMSEMKPYAYLFGWHSYCKDMEPEYLTMASRHALIIAEGLATLPNMSFHGKIPVSPDFHFKQKAKFNSNPKVADKVYITLIQSDGMGIGSWLKPGRGEIPYGWEANEEWFTVAPALLQFYYESATPNDYFIGSLSGPGYFYPKVFPADKLPGALRLENQRMQEMDLHVFGIMDFSEGDEFVGNIDLPQNIVDAYYANLPNAIGFINGYTQAHTYDCRNGRPLISYNYYVDPQKPVAEVVADLRELARINPKRPYYLPVHVRESNTVARIKTIIDQLGPEFAIVPPEELMLLAGKKPTMTTRYLDYHPDFSGHWKLDLKQSKNIHAYAVYELDIDHRGNIFTETTTARYQLYLHHRELKTSKTLVIGGAFVPSLEADPRRVGFMGGKTDSIRTRASWQEDGKALILTTEMMLETSQGLYPFSAVCHYRLSEDKMTLIVTETRPTRESPDPTRIFVYRRII